MDTAYARSTVSTADVVIRKVGRWTIGVLKGLACAYQPVHDIHGIPEMNGDHAFLCISRPDISQSPCIIEVAIEAGNIPRLSPRVSKVPGG